MTQRIFPEYGLNMDCQDNIVSVRCNLINSPMLNKLNNGTSIPGSPEKKLYQLIISRLDGDRIRSHDYREKIIGLVKKGIGGFIVFGGNRDEIKDFIIEIQSVAEIPLFIASDIERGVAQQIKGTTAFPCEMAVAAAIDRNKTGHINILEDAINAIAAEAIDVGINMPLIPVLDVNQNPENPIICTRAFSDNPSVAAWFGSIYIDILERNGLISCAKHFPGHGDTSVDSHISLPVISKSKEDLMNVDIIPFIEAIKAGVSSIMIGHIVVPVLDSMPASLSGKIITGLLREKIGFDGLVLTDALNMNALNGAGNVPVECIIAGADMLLHPLDADITAKELMAATDAGIISGERIDISLSRVAKAKARLKDIVNAGANYDGHQGLSCGITDMSVTLVKNTDGLLPISNNETPHLILAGDDKFFKESLLANYFNNVSVIGDLSSAKNDRLIFAVFTSVAAWKGSSGIDDAEREKIIELMRKAKASIVISFGSPYILRHFKEADILIAAYEATVQAQDSVIKCLTGKMDFRGRLPVRIDVAG